MAGGCARRQVVPLFLVLAGLFLMHGLSVGGVGGVGGCHGAAAMSMAQSMKGTQAQAAMPEKAAIVVPGPASDHADVGESCVPLRPEGLLGLFLALFLIVIKPWLPRLPQSVHAIPSRWPHGPPRTGVQILRTLSISRT